MNARLQLKLIKARALPAPKPGTWPRELGKPVDPMETHLAMRALSVLHSMDVRDPRGLSRTEATDVLKWAGQPI